MSDPNTGNHNQLVMEQQQQQLSVRMLVCIAIDVSFQQACETQWS